MSGVDLSRLPDPNLTAEAEYETLRAAWLADVAVRLRDFDAGGLQSEPVVIVCEAGSFRELLILQAINDSGRQCMLAYANGPNLDHLAANNGVERRAGEGDLALRLRAADAPRGISTAGPEAAYRRHALAASPDAADAAIDSPAPGSVTVTVLPRLLDAEPELALDSAPPAAGEAARALLRAGPAPELYRGGGLSGALVDGSEAIAGAGLVFGRVRYDASANPQTFELQAGPPGRGGAATLADWAGNAGAGASLFLLSASGGVEFPAAEAAASGARLSWSLAAAPARRAWLAGIAEDDRLLLLVADAGAVDVSKPPRVLVMLAAVEAALNAEHVRPMGDRVAVRAASDTPYVVRATLHVEAGPDRGAVLAAARASLRTYADGARRVGRMVPRSGLISALSVEGVFRVELAVPAADLAAVQGGVRTLGAVTLTGAAA